jgi:hypothetical protein
VSLPAVQLRPFAGGRDPATASGGGFVVGGEGAEDFVAIVPLGEVGAAGEPPVEPDIVEGVTPGQTVRRIVSGCGAVVTSATASCDRARFSVGWSAVTAAERDALIAWLLEDVAVGGAGGSLRAMAVRVDGPGGDTVEMRIIDAGATVESLLERVDGVVGGAGDRYSVGPFECEEIL